jgi:uncharacterized protein YlxW (UPF0749 family)
MLTFETRGNVMRTLIVLTAALVLTGTATASNLATPRERALTRQVSTLKAQVRKLKTDRARLSNRVLTLTRQRDDARAEVTRLKTLIVSSVQPLAEAWRNDGNPQTEVSYFESGDSYWSYTFTWCGFC